MGITFKSLLAAGISKIINHSQSRPLLTLFILLACSVFSFSQLDKVWVDTSAQSMMMADDPAILFHYDALKKFGSDTVTLVYVQDKRLFTPEKLKILEKLVVDLERIEGVTRVDSLFTTTNVKNKNGVLHSGPLMDKSPATLEEAVQAQKDSRQNPVIMDNLISGDGTATAINIHTEKDDDDHGFSVRMAEEIERAVTPYKSAFEKIFQMGRHYTIKSQSDTIRTDQRKIIPFSFIVLLTTLAILMRSFSAVALPVLTSVLSILWTFGFMGAAGIPVGVLTSIIPAITVTIGSTEDIHMLSEFMTGMAKTGDRKLSVQLMAKNVGVALALTTVTTIAGFLAISFNNIIVLREFGVTAAFSMFANAVITFLLAPVYLSYLGPTPLKQGSGGINNIIRNISGRMTDFISNYRRTIVVVAVGISMVFGFYGSGIKLDSNLRSFFKPDSEIIKRTTTIDNSLAGTNSFYILISGEPGDFARPDNLQQVEKLLEYIRGTSYFDKVISLNDFLKLTNREINGGKSDYYLIPENEDTIAEYLFLMHGEDIRRYVTSDYGELNIFVRHHIYSSKKLNSIISELSEKTSQIIRDPLKVRFTGENLLINKAVDTLVRGQVIGIVVLLLFIFVLISSLFRKIKLGALSLIPNILPVMILFGIMALCDIPLNTGTCMVAVIALGLAADDTIHFIVRNGEESLRTSDQRQALKATIDSEFLPIFCTSVSLALGFSVLCFSEFVPVIQLGFLSALVMALAILADLLVTPALILLFNSPTARKTCVLLAIIMVACTGVSSASTAVERQDNDSNSRLLREIEDSNEAPADRESNSLFSQLYRNLLGSIRVRYLKYYEESDDGPQTDVFEGRLKLSTFVELDNNRFFVSGWLEGGSEDNTWQGADGFFLNTNNHRAYAVLNELYLARYADVFNVYAGKMIFTNGISTLYSPADRYSPVDYTDPFEPRRLGLPLVRTDYFGGDWTLTGAVFPVYSPPKLPSDSSRWMIPGIEWTENDPDISFSNVGFFLRANTTAWGWDFYSSAFYGPQPNYTIDSAVFLQPVVIIDDPVREFNWAGGFSTAYKNFELHGEAVYTYGFELDEYSYISYVFGFSHTVSNPSLFFMDNIMLTAEYAGEVDFNRGERLTLPGFTLESDSLDNALVSRLSLQLNRYHDCTITWLYEFSDRYSLLELKWRYRVRDDLLFTAVLNTISTDKREYASWNDNDRISLALEYFF